MAKSNLELGAAELDVLKAIWERGPSTVRDVMEHLHAKGKRVAYTTVLTMLSRLEQKGAVSADKSEQAYVYRAKVTRERVTATRLKALAQQLYDGAATPLVLHLMESQKFTPEEIAQLHALIERLDRKE